MQGSDRETKNWIQHPLSKMWINGKLSAICNLLLIISLIIFQNWENAGLQKKSEMLKKVELYF